MARLVDVIHIRYRTVAGDPGYVVAQPDLDLVIGKEIGNLNRILGIVIADHVIREGSTVLLTGLRQAE